MYIKGILHIDSHLLVYCLTDFSVTTYYKIGIKGYFVIQKVSWDKMLIYLWQLYKLCVCILIQMNVFIVKFKCGCILTRHVPNIFDENKAICAYIDSILAIRPHFCIYTTNADRLYACPRAYSTQTNSTKDAQP